MLKAVCSIHPIGGLIESTMVVAPVNDNVQYNGFGPVLCYDESAT